MFQKDLVIEHGINLFLLYSLVEEHIYKKRFFSFPLPLFASSRSLSLSLPRSQIARSSPPSKAPALPCRSGSPRHRCNMSCRARARTSEKPVSKPGIPRRDRRSLVTWVTLFLSHRRRSGISAAAKGSATRRVARRCPRRPWRLSHESLPCCGRVCARA